MLKESCMRIGFLFFLTLLFLPGCVRFQPTKISCTPASHTRAETSSPLFTVTAHVLPPPKVDTTAQTITRDVILVEISITNKTSALCSFKPGEISPLPMTHSELCTKIPLNYTCYFIPALITGIGGFFFMWHIGLPLAGMFTLFGINQSRRAAKCTAGSFAKTLADPIKKIIIPSYSTQKFLLAWHRKNFASKIAIVLEQETQIHRCEIELVKELTHTYTFARDSHD